MSHTKSDALSSDPSRPSPDSMVECGLEEEDDWVVVKKQKITILVPPPSPLQPQRTSADKTEPVIVKRSSGVPNKSRHRLAKDKHKELSTTSALINGSEDDIGTTSQAQEPICNPIASPKKFKQPFLTKANDKVKSTVAHRKLIKFRRLLPSGAANVVNRRVRAVNLERKLKELGGLRRWLVSQGLDRFIKVFERENVGKYELVNLTMSMLKDMGTDAVGPRRKLIHAIDGLCQPDCFKALR